MSAFDEQAKWVIDNDALYADAVAVIRETKTPSISLVQRRLRIGYNRAALMLLAMEVQGIVGPMQWNGTREYIESSTPNETHRPDNTSGVKEKGD